MLVTRALAAQVHPVAMQAQTAIAGSLICLPALVLGAAAGSDLLAPVAPTALGWAVFGDFPGPLTSAGIAVISASGLYIIHRERVMARAAPIPDRGP